MSTPTNSMPLQIPATNVQPSDRRSSSRTNLSGWEMIESRGNDEERERQRKIDTIDADAVSRRMTHILCKDKLKRARWRAMGTDEDGNIARYKLETDNRRAERERRRLPEHISLQRREETTTSSSFFAYIRSKLMMMRDAAITRDRVQYPFFPICSPSPSPSPVRPRSSMYGWMCVTRLQPFEQLRRIRCAISTARSVSLSLSLARSLVR